MIAISRSTCNMTVTETEVSFEAFRFLETRTWIHTFVSTDSLSFSLLIILIATFLLVTQWTPSFTNPAKVNIKGIEIEKFAGHSMIPKLFDEDYGKWKRWILFLGTTSRLTIFLAWELSRSLFKIQTSKSHRIHTLGIGCWIFPFRWLARATVEKRTLRFTSKRPVYRWLVLGKSILCILTLTAVCAVQKIFHKTVPMKARFISILQGRDLI